MLWKLSTFPFASWDPSTVLHLMPKRPQNFLSIKPKISSSSEGWEEGKMMKFFKGWKKGLVASETIKKNPKHWFGDNHTKRMDHWINQLDAFTLFTRYSTTCIIILCLWGTLWSFCSLENAARITDMRRLSTMNDMNAMHEPKRSPPSRGWPFKTWETLKLQCERHKNCRANINDA